MDELKNKVEELRQQMLNHEITKAQWDMHFPGVATDPEFTYSNKMNWINKFVDSAINHANPKDVEWLEYYVMWYTTNYITQDLCDFEFEVLCIK